MKFVSFLTASLLLAIWPMSKSALLNWSNSSLKSAETKEVNEVAKLPSLSISYTLKTATQIEPLQGSLSDMKAGDIRMIQENPQQFEVVNDINEKGEPCFEVTKVSYDGNQEKGKSEDSNEKDNIESVTLICDGKLIHTQNGETSTSDFASNSEFWLEVIKSYMQTDKEIKNDFNSMLQALAQNGAVILEGEKTITIKENLPTGQSLVSVYDKFNYNLIYSGLQTNGETVKSFHYTYQCVSGGKVVPHSIRIKSKELAPISGKAYFKTKWQSFEDFNLSI